MNGNRMKRFGIIDFLIPGLVAAALVLLGLSLAVDRRTGDPEKAAEKMGRALEKRMAILDGYAAQALVPGQDDWLGHLDLPEDMVLYRYIEDTLQSWKNQFPVANDDIATRMVFQTIARPRKSLVSPLTRIGEIPSFENYGAKWYVVKAYVQGTRKIIAGLEVLNTLDERSGGGASPLLHMRRGLTVMPLSQNGGVTVSLQGEPLFKVVDNASSYQPSSIHSALLWSALLFVILAAFLFLSKKRTLGRLLTVLGVLTVIMSIAYLRGRFLKDSSVLFSPAIFADGAFFSSLGTVLLVSLYICLVVCCIFITRKDIFRRILRSAHPRGGMYLFGICDLALTAAVVVFTGMIFRSILNNSNINLELYKLNELDLFSLITYIDVIALLMMVPLLIQMLLPILKELFGIRHDAFSIRGRIVLAAIFAGYLVITAGVLGFRKEQNRVQVWANRLAMDRDISLELQLRMAEDKIASDQVIKSLSRIRSSNNLVMNRIRENYLFRILQDYDLTVELFRDNDPDEKGMNYYYSVISSGKPIEEGSHFLYMRDAGGHNVYAGNFTFWDEWNGLARMLVTISPKSNREDRGFASLLGFSAPGQVLIPARYSYAKYIDSKLTTYKGSYAYPTLMDNATHTVLTGANISVLRIGGYTHFVNVVSDDEIIFISRPKNDDFNYLVAILFLTLVLFFCLSTLTLTRDRVHKQERNYFKGQISTAMLLGLIMTLIALAAFSVIFVYKRNNANLRYSMVDKVNSLQTMLQSRSRFMVDYREWQQQETMNVLEDISSTMRSDITLYTVRGKEFMSSTPEVFERMLLGTRLNEDAYENIVYLKRRYFINREKIGERKVYFLYAPLFNAQGKMIAILSSPYTDESFDFKSEAILHSATIVTIFLILLLIARFVMVSVIDRMFKPISEVGKKMNAVDIGNLEYIVYERDDEVSSLVRAYNLMVHDLYESTRQLTQAERDKAWATMARQVAHEIKNPLTPIKLQIQRLIRMKKSGNPAWTERFDEVSEEVLRQIDLLADTANEFSTFAKLYTEESVEMDLDQLLQEEIHLFDSRENITFSYMGLAGTKVVGPKPQLTRVAANLISNAVQAIENEQEEQAARGETPFQGQVQVSLRHSSKDGFYDIVFEDNGPGVSDENRSKLFTPNFTTKQSGTGLGLAICRNILEKVGGDIRYSRSFSLGGACFTVRVPKPGKL